MVKGVTANSQPLRRLEMVLTTCRQLAIKPGPARAALPENHRSMPANRLRIRRAISAQATPRTKRPIVATAFPSPTIEETATHKVGRDCHDLDHSTSRRGLSGLSAHRTDRLREATPKSARRTPGGIDKAVKIVYGCHDDQLAAQEMKAMERIKEVRHPFVLSLERFEVVDGRLAILTELADMSLEQRPSSAALRDCRAFPATSCCATWPTRPRPWTTWPSGTACSISISSRRIC